ncbi:hypothetical protein FO519_010640, partial [Halicephalobus sp. NKZ332]
MHKSAIVIDRGVIQGKGLVTTEFIRKGEIVSDFVPGQPSYLLSEVLSMPPEKYEFLRHYCYQSSIDTITHEQGLEQYMNHSCDPNTMWICDETMVASRDILPGEELTYDYSTSEVTFPLMIECHCDSVNCRKIVTHLDYRIPAWQAKYGNMLPKHTIKIIAEWNASVGMKNGS